MQTLSFRLFSKSKGNRGSWTTSTDSGCYSSSSGERSPSASLGQVYPSSIPEHPSSDGHDAQGPQYATPYAVSNTRTRCMSESASTMIPYGMAHRRSDSEASSQSSYSGNDAPPPGKLNGSDSGYFSHGGYHHRSNPESIQENSAGYTLQKKAKAAAYCRSQSISGRPSASQQAQLAALASHAARSRSAPMPPMRKSSVTPPCPGRKTGLSDPELSTKDELDQGADEEAQEEPLSFLQKQIQQQRQLIKAKAKEKEQS